MGYSKLGLYSYEGRDYFETEALLGTISYYFRLGPIRHYFKLSFIRDYCGLYQGLFLTEALLGTSLYWGLIRDYFKLGAF